MTEEQIEVRPEQVWKDWDRRVRDEEPGRLIRVDSVGDTHAECTILASGKTTKIRLDRFRPTSKGYKLIENVPTDAIVADVRDDEPVSLSQRVAARRIRLARNEVERLERVVERRRRKGESTKMRKGEARLEEARLRLASLTI